MQDMQENLREKKDDLSTQEKDACVRKDGSHKDTRARNDAHSKEYSPQQESSRYCLDRMCI